MNTRPRLTLALASALLLAGAAGAPPVNGLDEEQVDYVKDVRPILEAFCYECHGEDRSRREADLRLDIKELAFKDLGGFPNIAPGDPDDSELYIRVSSEFAEMRMPPYEAGTQLTEEQIETIRLWILQGAEWPEDDDATADTQ
jgi:mono/diheme cytochrome c family protein